MGEMYVLRNDGVAGYHLGKMRDKETSCVEFRRHLRSLSSCLAYEAGRLLRMREVEVSTPLQVGLALEPMSEVFLVPILRAGLGMVESFLDLMPYARVAHLGFRRNEATHEAECYYENLPEDIHGGQVIVLDPMLATGGSAVAAVELLKGASCDVRGFVSCVAAPEGVATLQAAHPEVSLLIGALDEGLNELAYIVPGLGDAGDRCFGT